MWYKRNHQIVKESVILNKVEQSILMLSSSIAEKLNCPKVETKIKDIEKDVNVIFGEVLAAKLKKITQKERIKKLKKIIDILWM
ncbi:hypothetical protein PUN28_010486 [Cardiocondyla obscurior]|uniref:Uncharacterized protein n=1 Tax=Cardiocondyla obscurior TaxID=286306 RepID=A0AAW2FIJ4_9HYME